MGRPKSGVETPKIEPGHEFASKAEVDAVRSDIGKVTDALLALSEKIDGLKKEEKASIPSPLQVSVDESDPAKRMPRTYRQIVDELLSPHIPASVEWRTDGNFELALEIPKEFSNATPSHWSMYKNDLRIKVIPNALAENGVRDFVQAVVKNLGEVTVNNIKQMK